ncbi:MAG: alcohol dehydrogenase catalytic domain-containing protein, partial [Actinobacteria bacterium]|nr:alcohol dehydrogenase catalytic domain-containing protein [Actinomycetota bacterium]
MRAARLHAVGDLRLADEPEPVPEPGSSLVRVTAVGICGSDLHWWGEAGIGDARLAAPLVLGHEAAGVIAAGPRRGERVAIDPAIPCGACRPCRSGYRNLCVQIRFAGHGGTDGAMREFLSWPDELLHPLPDTLSDADGAVLEPLGVALHALDLGHVRFGAVVAVAGLGPIGLLLVQVLRAAGASMVAGFDPLPHRREAALRLGADLALDPADGADGGGPASGSDDGAAGGPARGPDGGAAGSHARGAIGGDGADVAFEMAGTSEAVDLAMTLARPGGRVVLGGIPGDDRTVFRASTARRKGLTIAMVRRMNEAYPRAISVAVRGRADLAAVVTARFPLA